MANKNRNKAKKVGVDLKYKNIIDVNLLALMLLATLVWWFNYSLNFKGFNALTSDAISYANMASNFLNGEGFTLNFTIPVEASLLKRDSIFPIPSPRSRRKLSHRQPPFACDLLPNQRPTSCG